MPGEFNDALFNLTASEAASLVRSRSLSPVDLMESLLTRTAALEPALRVWAAFDPDSAMARPAMPSAGSRMAGQSVRFTACP